MELCIEASRFSPYWGTGIATFKRGSTGSIMAGTVGVAVAVAVAVGALVAVGAVVALGVLVGAAVALARCRRSGSGPWRGGSRWCGVLPTAKD